MLAVVPNEQQQGESMTTPAQLDRVHPSDGVNRIPAPPTLPAYPPRLPIHTPTGANNTAITSRSKGPTHPPE